MIDEELKTPEDIKTYQRLVQHWQEALRLVGVYAARVSIYASRASSAEATAQKLRDRAHAAELRAEGLDGLLAESRRDMLELERKLAAVKTGTTPPVRQWPFPVVAWRTGRRVPINVYEGDRPVCQCHTQNDADLIVTEMNYMLNYRAALHLGLQATGTRLIDRWHEGHPAGENFSADPATLCMWLLEKLEHYETKV